MYTLIFIEQTEQFFTECNGDYGVFGPSDNYIHVDKPKVDFVRLILERDVRVTNHAAYFPVPGVYSPLGLCLLLSLFFVVKEITAYSTIPFTSNWSYVTSICAQLASLYLFTYTKHFTRNM
jgi:hypothetical protein